MDRAPIFRSDRIVVGSQEAIIAGTGPERWNPLGLWTNALFSAPLVYNAKRSGTFDLGGRRFVLRRVAFPGEPTPEWYVIDLLENAGSAGASRVDLANALERAVAERKFNPERLVDAARRYGTRKTREFIERALEAVST